MIIRICRSCFAINLEIFRGVLYDRTENHGFPVSSQTNLFRASWPFSRVDVDDGLLSLSYSFVESHAARLIRKP